jgi:hypothetical protein
MNLRPGAATLTPQLRERSPGRPRPYQIFRDQNTTEQSILGLNLSDDEIDFNPQLLAQSLSPTEESYMLRRRNI